MLKTLMFKTYRLTTRFFKTHTFFKKSSLFLATVSMAGLMSSLPLQAMENPRDEGQELKVPPVLQQQRAVVLSDELDQQVLDKLQGFGLTHDAIEKIWEEFRKVMPKKGPLQALVLASMDPHYIAFGLWKVEQEQTCLGTTPTALPMRAMLSCLLTKDFSSLSINRKISPISLSDAQLLGRLIQSNPYFTSLELFKISITDEHLEKMGILPHLAELSLEENSVTDEGLKIVLSYPCLGKLNIAKNQITPKGTKVLKDNKTLRHLNVYKNPIGDEGAEDLSHNTTLTYLDLRETGVGDRGAIALASNNKTITDLRLRYNKITDKGAEAFLKCHHLTSIELARNDSITPDLVSFLETLMHSNAFYKTRHLHCGIFELPPQKSRVRILTIDGGGIRGLLPSCILKAIADNLTLKTGSQFHFAEHVDLMAGTSTGGIITLGLTMPGDRGRPMYTPQTLVDLYENNGPEIFPAPWCCLKFLAEATYNPAGIETYLTKFFGDTYISECCCPTILMSFDLQNNEPHTFDSFEAKRDESKNFQMRGAGRATSAAPTYFPAAEITNKQNKKFQFVDGGIYANNPTLFALLRAQSLYPDAEEYIVYSLGTGEVPKTSLAYLADAGLIKWGLNIADILMDNAAECTEKLLKKEIARDPRIKYVRIQPQLQNSEEAMDNVTPANIQKLLATAGATIEKEHAVIQDMIDDFYRDFEASSL